MDKVTVWSISPPAYSQESIGSVGEVFFW